MISHTVAQFLQIILATFPQKSIPSQGAHHYFFIFWPTLNNILAIFSIKIDATAGRPQQLPLMFTDFKQIFGHPFPQNTSTTTQGVQNGCFSSWQSLNKYFQPHFINIKHHFKALKWYPLIVVNTISILPLITNAPLKKKKKRHPMTTMMQMTLFFLT